MGRITQIEAFIYLGMRENLWIPSAAFPEFANGLGHRPELLDRCAVRNIIGGS